MRKFEGFYRGINLGGWLSQGSLAKEHLDTFITEEDIIKIKSMGIDHIRIPVDFELIEDDKVELMLAPALEPKDFNADIPFAPSNNAQAPGLFSNSTNPSKAPLRISPQSISRSAL